MIRYDVLLQGEGQQHKLESVKGAGRPCGRTICKQSAW